MERICLVCNNLTDYKKKIKSYLDDGWKMEYSSKNCAFSRVRSNQAEYTPKTFVAVLERKRKKKTQTVLSPCKKIVK